MRLHLFGCNYRSCGLATRERLSVDPARLPGLLSRYRLTYPGVEIVVISTCQRVELYFADRGDRELPDSRQALQLLMTFLGRSWDSTERDFFQKRDDDAARHLFLVTCGLDSAVLGETQVSGQVRAAYRIAQEQSCVGPVTHRLFQSAFRASKRVARETGLGRETKGIPQLAVHRAWELSGARLPKWNILVVGAGTTAAAILDQLTRRGCPQITVVNRTRSRSRDLAERFGVSWVSWAALPTALERAQVLFTATTAPGRIFYRREFERLPMLEGTPCRFIFDLAVPRDVDPEVASLPSIVLNTVDDLATFADQQQPGGNTILQHARRIVEQELGKSLSALHQQRTSAELRNLHRVSKSIEDQELLRLQRKLPNLDLATMEQLRRAMRRYARKLLHPIYSSVRGAAEPLARHTPSGAHRVRRAPTP